MSMRSRRHCGVQSLFLAVWVIGCSGGNFTRALAEVGTAPPPRQAEPAPLLAATVQRPNIVIVVADDLGWNDVGYHGSEIPTPHIDRLVAEGVELTRFYSFPVCSATRAGLLTGRSPIRLGLTQPLGPRQDGLALDEHLLSQTLQAAGFQTFICGKWHLGGTTDDQYLPHHRGFDHFYGFVGGAVDYYTHKNRRDERVDWQRNGEPVREDGYTTDLLADEAIRLLKGRDRGRPVFLYLCFNAVHTPLMAPEALIRKYDHIEDLQRRTYAAMVDAMDAALGRVLSTIDDEGMKHDTLVLFMSDNGGQERRGGASNRPLRGGKGSVFEGGIRVSAAIRWPAVFKPGLRSGQVFSVMDVFPTLAAAAGLEAANNKPFDGRNLWPSIRDGKDTPPEGLVIASRDAAVLHGAWKLVRLGGTERSLLFRISDDPNEEEDLSAANPQEVRSLSDLITSMTELMPQTGRGGRRGR